MLTAPQQVIPDRGFPLRKERLLTVLLWSLLFLAYPVGLVAPPGTWFDLVFHLALPVAVVAAAVALPTLLFSPLRPFGSPAHRIPGRLFLAWAGLFCAWAIAAAITGKTPALLPVVTLLASAVVPAFFALAPRRYLPRHPAEWLTVLWAVQLTAAVLGLCNGLEMVALAGNRNWAATLIVALTPWPWVAWNRLRRRAGTGRKAAVRVAAAVLAAGTVLSAFLAYRGQSRGTWLCLAAYGLCFVLLPRLRPVYRAAVAAGIGVLVLVIAATCTESVTRILAEDIRPPLYLRAAGLVGDHPLLGVGPGNFRREFVAYKSAEHRSRAVAGTVTEHPHNEWLHMAAQGGIPLGILWAGLWLVPLVVRIPKRFGQWQAVHFTAAMLVGHGMLDKVLVMPPGSLLAAYCVGLLWRRAVAARLRPELRRPPARSLAVVAAAAAGFLAADLSVRELIRGYLFRDAYKAEGENRNEDAYEAYRLATLVAPGDVRTHAFAGISANNRLRDPVTALKHIEDAMQLEPNFAHLNGEAGLGLGSMGKHEEARPFMLREAELFPFDVRAHEQLFVNTMANGLWEETPALHERLLTLYVRAATVELGRERAAALCETFLEELQSGNGPAAARAAIALMDAAQARLVDPEFERLSDKRWPPGATSATVFGPADFVFWRAALLQRRAVPREVVDPAEISRSLRAAGLPDDAVSVARTAVACGTEALLVRTVAGGGFSVLFPGAPANANCLPPAPATREEAPERIPTGADGLFAAADPEAAEVLLPYPLIQYLGKHRALSAILAAYAAPDAPPPPVCHAAPLVARLRAAAFVRTLPDAPPRVKVGDSAQVAGFLPAPSPPSGADPGTNRP